VYDPRQQREQQALMPLPRSAGIEPVGATPLGDPAAEQREVGRRALAGVLWTTVEVWGERLLQFGFFVLLSRLLGPDAYGLIGIALQINFAGEVLFAQGPWADAIGRDPCPTPERWSSLFWLLLAAGATLALLAVAAAAPTAWVFGQPALVQVMPCLAPALPLTALGVLPSALLRRELRFAPFAARSALAGLVAGAVATAALAGAGVWSLVLLQLVQPAVAAIVLWHAVPWRPARHFRLAEMRPTLAFVAGGMAERLVLVADALLLRVVIGKALGPTTLGHYVLATKALELLTQLLMRPVARVALPSAVRLAADPLALRRLAELGLEMAALIAFPAGLALAACATDLVAAIFGPAWAPSGVGLQLMAVAVAVSPVAQLCTSLGYGRAPGRAGSGPAGAAGGTAPGSRHRRSQRRGGRHRSARGADAPPPARLGPCGRAVRRRASRAPPPGPRRCGPPCRCRHACPPPEPAAGACRRSLPPEPAAGACRRSLPPEPAARACRRASHRNCWSR
jgi:O-antigen/teichoic acid export membrane protein